LKIPKQIRTYCAKCKSHTNHSVSLYKKAKGRTMAHGTRHHAEDKKGYGGQKFPELKRTAKTTKKQVINLKCGNCSRIQIRLGIRLRKLEITQ
jgi:large subunit ribosomal protein L44e